MIPLRLSQLKSRADGGRKRQRSAGSFGFGLSMKELPTDSLEPISNVDLLLTNVDLTASGTTTCSAPISLWKRLERLSPRHPLLLPILQEKTQRLLGGWYRPRNGKGRYSWLRPGEGDANCAEPPPSVKPAARLDPSGPSERQSWGCDRHRGKWVRSGGAGRIGSKRLDPGAPTTPRPTIAGRPGACHR
jgi:hypothetical protein